MKKRVLVVDVGGNNVKLSMAGHKEPLKIPSGPKLTPAKMAAEVAKAVAGWKYDAVTIGYPGATKNGRPAREPHNLGGGWVRFDYGKAFKKPVRLVNDAALQALGSYEGGRMLFLGLGTGLGSALVADGVLMPLELAHLPYRKGRTYEDYVGERGLKRMGAAKWTRHVARVVALLKHALQADHVVLGGGQTRKLEALPPGARVGSNTNALTGGIRLWDEAAAPPRRRPPLARSRKAGTKPASSSDAAAPGEPDTPPTD